MTARSPLSVELTAIAELVAESLHGATTLPLAKLYARLVHARDEAICLEARAGARTDVVRGLIADLANQCTELATHAALLPIPGIPETKGTMQ